MVFDRYAFDFAFTVLVVQGLNDAESGLSTRHYARKRSGAAVAVHAGQ